MKKVNLKGKLSLKKEAITKLSNEQMANVFGGSTNTCYGTCWQPQPNSAACQPTCFRYETTLSCCA